MPITRYRKRPIEVDTIQWTGDNLDELINFTSGNFLLVDPGEGLAPEITAKVYDELHCTWVLLTTGQHVVRGVKGEFYPIAEDVLAETYEPAVVPPVDRVALRDRIAEVLYERERPPRDPHWPKTFASDRETFEAMADAVLAVLPGPADRAAVLREAAAVAGRIADEARKKRFAKGQGKGSTVLGARLVGVKLRELAHDERRMAAETQPAEAEPTCMCGHPMRLHHEDVCTTNCGCDDGQEPDTATDLAARLEGALTKRFTELGNPGSQMRYHEQGPDGWPASHPVGPRMVAEVLRELLAKPEAVVEARQDGAQAEADNPRTVCVCGHTRGEHARVSGRLLCDACDPDSTDNLVCKEFEAL